MDKMLCMECRECGVGLEPTGRPGRPFERCESCREKRYASEVCHRCGKSLPEKRNKQSSYCDKRCQNSAWKAADRWAAALATDQ